MSGHELETARRVVHRWLALETTPISVKMALRPQAVAPLIEMVAAALAQKGEQHGS